MNLSSTIKSIQDIMRKDDGVDGDAQRIGQLTWMLFLKIFDQCEETWEDDAADKRKKYKSPIPEDCRWRNWAKYIEDDKGKRKPRIQASELIRHVNDIVFPGLQTLDIEGNPKAKVVRDVFQDTNNYMKSGTQMLAVIEKLDEAVNFHDIKSRGQLGDVYEQILNDLRSAGNAGEFYTPRAITEFMVKMVNPNLKKRETVLDPACGTGGFLTATIAHLEGQISKKSGAEDRKAIARCIRGIEKKQLPHLLCVTNMMLHGIDVPSMIEHRNTLAAGWNDWKLTERVNCVITNPPFGGMEDDGVGNDYPLDVRTRETADMFIVLIVKKILAIKGGRGAVVLPDGTLFGEGVKAKVKKLLMEECHLHTIIRLPNGVFAPYTGIKTNLLFFTKGKPTDTIWYYEHRYPAGVKSYSKTKPLRVEEFDPIALWWGKESDGFAARTESEQAWKIDFKKLKKEAEARAKPYWELAEDINNQVADIQAQIRERRSAAKSIEMASVRARMDRHISELAARLEPLQEKAKEQQSIGDLLERFIVIIALVVVMLWWRQITYLSRSAVIGGALVLYTSWALGDWHWLLAPAMMMLGYTLLCPEARPQSQSVHTVHGVFCVAFASLFWLFLSKSLNCTNLIYPYGVAYATHLGMVALAYFARADRAGVSFFAIVKATLLGFSVTALPYLWVWRNNGHEGILAIAALIFVALSVLIFSKLQPNLPESPNDTPRWLRQGAIGLVASLLAFVLITLIEPWSTTF